jgi:hypothetical protein
MNYDYSKLRGRIVEYYGKQSDFAKILNLSNVSLNKKLNNRVKFTQDEIRIMIDKLNIKKVEVEDYFFTIKVENK